MAPRKCPEVFAWARMMMMMMSLGPGGCSGSPCSQKAAAASRLGGCRDMANEGPADPAAVATVPGVTERYFTRWYKPDVKGNLGEDHCILQHSNRICIITLADAHPLLQKGKPIESISYQISANCSRLQNKVSGKSKRGAQFLTELAPLCRISCADGEEYTIYSCIRGKLIEVNENILDNPSLLQEKPSTEGYIAVVLPKFEESKKITDGLLTRKEYEEVLSKRFNSTS